jgi:hypothetical protein
VNKKPREQTDIFQYIPDFEHFETFKQRRPDILLFSERLSLPVNKEPREQTDMGLQS